MTDVKIIIDAVKSLNSVWKNASKDVEKENIPAELYNATCEIDEAIIVLIERVGMYAKASAIFDIYCDVISADEHKVIAER